MSGIIAGGISAAFGWRWAFIVLAIPTFFLLTALSRLREPKRGESIDVDLAEKVEESQGAVPYGEARRQLYSVRTTLTLVSTDPFSALNPRAIVACVQASGWGATDHGEWFSAPDADCEAGSAVGAATESTISWTLSPAFKRGDRPFIEVMLVPAEDATPFRVPFEAPGADALTAPVELVTPTTAMPPPRPTVATSTTEPAKQFGGAQVASASPPSTSPPTTAPVQATPPPPNEVASGPVTPASATDTTGERILAAALLAVLALSLWAASADRERMLALLGSVPVFGGRVRGAADEERVGGVGRFSRPREDPPTRI